jgi:hypothetical protein
MGKILNINKKYIFCFNKVLNKFKSIPPVRSLATAKKKKKKKKQNEEKPESDAASQEKPGKSVKINSYDYRAWDKLDVVGYIFYHIYISQNTHLFLIDYGFLLDEIYF